MKPTKQERDFMIKSIYEKVANKELSFGCKFVVNNLPVDFYVRTQNGIIYGKYMRYYNSKGFKKIGHQVMIGDVLDWVNTNKKQLEDKLNSCPNCGGKIEYQEGQISFPETGQWDFPSEYYCSENHDKCEWSDTTNRMGIDWEGPTCIENLINDLVIGYFYGEGKYTGGLWKYKCKPIDDQTDECIEYIYNLLKEYETTR